MERVNRIRLPGVDIGGKQDLKGIEPQGPEGLVEKPADRNPAFPLIAGKDVLVSGGIIEFLLAGVDDNIIVLDLPEIDLRLFDLQTGLGNRRNILDQQGREPFGRNLVDHAESQTIPVGVDQMLVDPALAGQIGIGQLPGGEHDLAVFVVDPVAVVVYGPEFIIGADFLKLAEGLQQRLVVPEPDVFDGQAIALDQFRGQRSGRRERTFFHPVQTKALQGTLDIAGQVGSFFVNLIRRDYKALDSRRQDMDADQINPNESH